MAELMDVFVRASAILSAAGLRPLVIGAFGLILHASSAGRAFTTEDVDLLMPPDEDGFLRAVAALRDAGFVLEAGGEPLVTLDAQAVADLVRHGATVRAICDDVPVDLVQRARGIDFEDCWRRARPLTLEGVEVRVAPLVDIVRSKLLAGRLKDRLVLEAWREQLLEMLHREGVDPPAGF